jgi:hypothetical protein
MIFTKNTIPNFYKAVIRVLKKLRKNESVLLSDEEYSKRLTICITCPYQEDNQCQKCTCFIFAKCRLSTETCPIGKW